jgi:hypothetical protein
MKYMESSDPIRLFFEMAVDTSSAEAREGYETKSNVYDSFERFCKEKRLPMESCETFNRRLKTYGLCYKQKKIDGANTWVWINMKLKDYTKVDEGQETL